MRSVGHIARMIGKPEGKKHHKDIGVEEKIILNSILTSIMVRSLDWSNLVEDRSKIR